MRSNEKLRWQQCCATFLPYLDVPVELPHYRRNVSDVLLQELPCQPVTPPFVLHSVQRGNNVLLNAESVFHKGRCCFLMAQDSVLQLIHQAGGCQRDRGQCLAVQRDVSHPSRGEQDPHLVKFSHKTLQCLCTGDGVILSECWGQAPKYSQREHPLLQISGCCVGYRVSVQRQVRLFSYSLRKLTKALHLKERTLA